MLGILLSFLPLPFQITAGLYGLACMTVGTDFIAVARPDSGASPSKPDGKQQSAEKTTREPFTSNSTYSTSGSSYGSSSGGSTKPADDPQSSPEKDADPAAAQSEATSDECGEQDTASSESSQVEPADAPKHTKSYAGPSLCNPPLAILPTIADTQPAPLQADRAEESTDSSSENVPKLPRLESTDTTDDSSDGEQHSKHSGQRSVQKKPAKGMKRRADKILVALANRSGKSKHATNVTIGELAARYFTGYTNDYRDPDDEARLKSIVGRKKK